MAGSPTSQRLLRKPILQPDERLMIVTPCIRDCINNRKKTKLIQKANVTIVSQYRMQPFDHSILNLYKKDLITYDGALRRASILEEFKLKIQGIQSTSDLFQDEMEKSMSDFMDGRADSEFKFS